MACVVPSWCRPRSAGADRGPGAWPGPRRTLPRRALPRRGARSGRVPGGGGPADRHGSLRALRRVSGGSLGTAAAALDRTESGPAGGHRRTRRRFPPTSPGDPWPPPAASDRSSGGSRGTQPDDAGPNVAGLRRVPPHRAPRGDGRRHASQAARHRCGPGGHRGLGSTTARRGQRASGPADAGRRLGVAGGVHRAMSPADGGAAPSALQPRHRRRRAVAGACGSRLAGLPRDRRVRRCRAWRGAAAAP